MIFARCDEVLVSFGISLLWNQTLDSISRTINTYVPVYKIKKLKAHSKPHKNVKVNIQTLTTYFRIKW